MRFEPNQNFRIRKSFEKADIRQALLNNLEQLCEKAFGKQHKTTRGNAWRYDDDGKIIVDAETGSYYSFSLADGGNIFDIAKIALGIEDATFPEVLQASGEWLNIKPDYTPSKTFRSDKSNKTELERITEANAIWFSSLPFTGTPAEKYLISRHITDLPEDSCRWHPIKKCIVFPIENISARCAGRRVITGVSVVYLDENGNKREVYDATKRVHGHKKGNAVCFPGTDLKGEFIRAEGAETALSIWLAFNGQLTVIATCGTARELDVPENRHVIDCRDDDKQFTSNGKPNIGPDKAAAAIKRQVLKRGGMYNEVWPYGKRTHTGHDFNDLLVEYGPEFVKNSIEQQIARSIVEDNSIELTVKNKPEAIPAQVIEDQIHGQNYLHVGKTSVGVGKTHEIIHNAIVRFSEAIDKHMSAVLSKTTRSLKSLTNAELDKIEDIILVLVPTHKLSHEFSDRLTRDTGISCEIYKSIEQMDPENPDQQLCKRAAEIAPHRANMIDMQKEICASCPFFKDCGFQKQLRRLEFNRPRVLVASHNMLQSGKMPKQLRGRKIASIIVDESPLTALEKKLVLSVAEINEPLHPSVQNKDQRALLKNKPSILQPSEKFLTALNETIKEFVKSGKPIGAYDFAKSMTLRFYPFLAQAKPANFANHTLDMLTIASENIYKMLLGPSDEKDWKNRAFNARVMRMIGFIDELKDIAALDVKYGIDGSKSSSDVSEAYKIERLRNGWQPLISFVFDEKTATTHLKMNTAGVHRNFSYAPIIFMDATAEMSVVEPMLGRHISSSVVADIAAPHARFFQEVSRSYSKTYLSKKKNLEKIADFIARKTKGMSSVLIVTNKDINNELREIPSLKHCAFEHFNAVAGLDGYKHYEACFVIGRPQPAPEDVRGTIHALGGTHDAKEWQQIEKSRTVLIGGKKWTAKFKGAGSSDPIANGVLQQTATGQVIQGLGRLRQIWREEGSICDTYILSDVSVPFPVEVINPAEVDLFDDHHRMQVRGIIFDMPAAEAKVSEGTALAISNRTLEERRAKLRDYGVDQTWRAQYTAFYYRLAGAGMKLQSGLFDSRFTAEDVKRIIVEHLGEIAEFAHTDFDAETFAKPQPVEAFDELNFTPQALIEPEEPAYMKQICGASAPPT